MNNKSNEIWKNENNYTNWELRRYRFTDEMRLVFFHYLGITPDSHVLDGGCGTGVLTRYLAKGLKNGRITGFDISKNLVDYGNARIKDEKLTEVCQLEEADGFELPYENGTFDAVTNYTYLGVLSDPMAGLKELIRVCKPGGTVSAVLASNSFPGIHCKGEYPFKESRRLDELYKRQDEIYHKVFDSSSMYYQSQEWDAEHYPKMFDICGLKDIHIYPFAIGFSYSDSRWPLEYRRLMVDDGINDELRIIAERSHIAEFENHGFTKADFAELIELLNVKRKYLIENLETDRSYEWNAALNLVVTGKTDKLYKQAGYINIMRICNMNMTAAKDISSWKYEAPYEIYNLDGSEECIEELMNGSYYTTIDENSKLMGYVCFGQSARVPAGISAGAYDRKDVTDIGLGLRPDLCGKGLGLSLLAAGMEYGKELYGKQSFRLTVAIFNFRAAKVYERAGFIIDKTFNKISDAGNIGFQTMIKI